MVNEEEESWTLMAAPAHVVDKLGAFGGSAVQLREGEGGHHRRAAARLEEKEQEERTGDRHHIVRCESDFDSLTDPRVGENKPSCLTYYHAG
jgi:hypothetical protein